MNDDRELDRILSKREMVSPASNLSSRIVAAAKSRQNISIWDRFVNEIMEMLLIPRPAYVLAAFLVIGLFIGLGVESDSAASVQDWLSFAEIDEGEWL